MKKSITENQAEQLRYLFNNMARLLGACHKSSGQHTGKRCGVCKAIERTQQMLDDIIDRRKSDRVFHRVKAEGYGPATGHFTSRLSDLSTTGAFVDSVKGFAEGTVFRMKFHIDSKEVDVTSEVRYNIEHIGMGIRFIEITDEDRRAIKKFLRSKSAE
jgi:hypothetical protein